MPARTRSRNPGPHAFAQSRTRTRSRNPVPARVPRNPGPHPFPTTPSAAGALAATCDRRYLAAVPGYASTRQRAHMAARQKSPPQNTAALGVGFGIGILWWIMGITSLWSSFRGYGNERYDWGLAWGLIGLLLLAAGTAAMVGTWMHLTRAQEH
jgi:hypothetical protein